MKLANVRIQDSNGTWSINDLNSADFADPVITQQSATSISMSGTNGLSLRFDGDFSNASPYVWELTDLYLYSYGNEVFSMTEFSESFYDLATMSGAALERSILAGTDTITSNSAVGNLWYTYGGDDTIALGSGDDTIDAGTGTDTLVLNTHSSQSTLRGLDDLFSSYSSVQVSSAMGTDRISNIEILKFIDRSVALSLGNAGNDRLRGDAQSVTNSDVMAGGFGNDTLDGGLQNDLLYGNANDDHLSGGSGRDTLFGGTGDDHLTGNTGSDRLVGAAGDDVIEGGSGRDRALGGGGADEITGGNHRDILNGGGGNDTLTGGAGGDRLTGGNGRDRLIGHKGDDKLTGGGRADIFVFKKGHGDDTISDFTVGTDRIEIGRGASRFGELDIEQQQDDVLVSFANVTILIEDAEVQDIAQADNFLF